MMKQLLFFWLLAAVSVGYVSADKYTFTQAIKESMGTVNDDSTCFIKDRPETADNKNCAFLKGYDAESLVTLLDSSPMCENRTVCGSQLNVIPIFAFEDQVTINSQECELRSEQFNWEYCKNGIKFGAIYLQPTIEGTNVYEAQITYPLHPFGTFKLSCPASGSSPQIDVNLKTELTFAVDIKFIFSGNSLNSVNELEKQILKIEIPPTDGVSADVLKSLTETLNAWLEDALPSVVTVETNYWKAYVRTAITNCG